VPLDLDNEDTEEFIGAWTLLNKYTTTLEIDNVDDGKLARKEIQKFCIV
jgi:hypothetical protein